MKTRWMMSAIWGVLTLLASALPPVRMQATVRAVVGENVLLPCHCPPGHRGDPYLVWQIGQHTNVAYAIANETKGKVDPQYRNRCRLFYPADRGNCSLLLLRVRVSDGRTYSCHYEQEHTIRNITVALEVTANYSLQCWENSSGGRFHCSANGGFPRGRIYWLQAGRAVEELQEGLGERQSQEPLTGLYDITSNLTHLSTHTSALQCVVENPALQLNISTTCTHRSLPSVEPFVSVELKASLAAGSVLLLLAAIFLFVLIKVWKPCHSTKQVPGQYALARSAKADDGHDVSTATPQSHSGGDGASLARVGGADQLPGA